MLSMGLARPDCGDHLTVGHDPIVLLKNEHATLLGQLSLLDRGGRSPKHMATLLKTLIRDMTVHFNRESVLVKELTNQLKQGGRSLHTLLDEQHELGGQADKLLASLEAVKAKTVLATRLRQQVGEFTTRVRAHITHVEQVVFLLATTRLTEQQQRQAAVRMLTQ